MPASVLIGLEGNNHVRIEVLRRLHADSQDRWERNCLDARIHVAGGAFSGAYRALVTTFDFERFKAELDELYRSLAGTATFSCEEEDLLSLELSGDRQGHLSARCTARDAPYRGAELHFRIDLDQSYLPEVLDQLTAILEQFPVVALR